MGVAQTPTWSNDVACILYTHCTTCHHDNGIAPFALTSYTDAQSHMALMYTDINNHIMPPYPPDVNYQHYIGERYLNSNELSILNAWIHAGGPEGDSAQAPPKPVYTPGAVITNPDFTARIPTYTVPQINSDLYRCFIISNPSAQTKYVTGLEVIPGNNEAVHHVIVYADTSAKPIQLDSADPGLGYTEFGGDGSNSGQMLGVWTPGADPYYTPPGMGITVPAGARIIVQIHYPATSSGMVDSTRVNLKFSSNANVRQVSIAQVLNYYTNMTNGPLVIPANAVDTFYEELTVPAKVTVLSVSPHSHLICTDMKSFGVQPNGDTIPFVTEKWNFHWQGFYSFKKPIVLPLGTKIYGKAIYDNTSNNPLNPNFPPQPVVAGESTTNEMMIFFFSYTLYQAGDENAVYDTTTYIHTYDGCTYTDIPNAVNEIPQLKAVAFPNPTTGLLEVNVTGTNACTGIVTDITGKQINTLHLNGGFNSVDISALSTGMYFITLADNEGNLKPQTLRIVKE